MSESRLARKEFIFAATGPLEGVRVVDLSRLSNT